MWCGCTPIAGVIRWVARVVDAVAAPAAGAALASAAAGTAGAVVTNATRWLRGLERLSMQCAFPKGTSTGRRRVMDGRRQASAGNVREPDGRDMHVNRRPFVTFSWEP